MDRRMKTALVWLGIIVVINIVFSLWSVRLDCTAENRFSLSDETRRVLGSLPRAVTIDFYRSDSVSGVPASLQNYGDYAEGLLHEYSRHSNGKLKIVIHDPAVGTQAEEDAMRSGMIFEELRPGDTSSRYCLGLCMRSLGRSDVSLRQLNPAAINGLEYDLTKSLAKIAEEVQTTVGVISKLPLFGGIHMEQQRQLPEWALLQAMRDNNFKLVDLGNAPTDFPDSLDILMLVHPPELSLDALKAIDNFVLKGGRVLAFLDSGCWTDMMFQQGPRAGKLSVSDLPGLLKAWGVTFHSDKIALSRTQATIVLNRNSVPENHLGWLTVTDEQLSQTHEITSRLDKVEVYHSGVFEYQQKDGVHMASLLRTSKDAQIVEGVKAFRARQLLERDYTSGNTEHHLALSLEGNLPSAFVSSSSEGAQVILVGDADCLHDSFIEDRKTDNLQFVLNCLDSLRMKGTGLLELRNRSYSLRRLTALAERAEQDKKTYQEQLESFQTERNALREKAQELEGRRNEGLLTDAEGEELRKMYRDILKADRSLRRLQAQANRSQERYRQGIVLFNLLFGPGILAAILLFIPVVRFWKNERRLALLWAASATVLVLVCVGLGFWERHASTDVQQRAPLLGDKLSQDDLTAVTFIKGNTTFTMKPDQDGVWKIAEKGNFPCDIALLNQLTASLNMGMGERIEVKPEDLNLVHLGKDQGYEVEFCFGDAKQRITFGDWKRNYANEPTGRYIRNTSGDVMLASNSFHEVGRPMEGWLARKLPGFGNQAKRISRESEFKALRWSLERRTGGYEIQGDLPAGMGVHASVVKNIVDNFRYLAVLDAVKDVQGFTPKFQLQIIGDDDVLYDYAFGEANGKWFCKLKSAKSATNHNKATRIETLYKPFFMEVNGKLARAFLRDRNELFRRK